MKITLAQLNPTIGDFQGNLNKLERAIMQTGDDGSDLLVLSELYITGYPPRDLLERKWFIGQAHDALREVQKLSKRFPEIGILVGVPLAYECRVGCGLSNSAVLILSGKIIFTQHKSLLPTYDVFDEARYFDPSFMIMGGCRPEDSIDVVKYKGEILGITICEDAWNDSELASGHHYDFDPVAALARKGATLIINISASPWCIGKDALRFRVIRDQARKHKIPFVLVNQVGANDELIFDGCSVFADSDGDPVRVLSAFEEAVVTIDTAVAEKMARYPSMDKIKSVHDALVLGLRDYMRKCGFERAVVGLSGGIDSAVTVALAVEAVGSENVMGITMPSPYSAEQSFNDSLKLAENLGIKFETIPISDIYRAYLDTLENPLSLTGKIEVTQENIQARIRGNILMAVSNRLGYLVLSTGNKSELAVGYCTLYGDMSGGLAVISDVPKTMVYEIAGYINREREIIPEEILKRAPSAELRPNQTDQDTLPPYPLLDKILEYYIDEGMSVEEIIGKSFDEETVRWVVRAVNRNEYKRRQAAPGLKVTSKAFGMGRRMVIAAKYE